MAEILKSALFVDYDSIHRSLAAAGRDGDALAQRTSAWVVAIESGRLVTVKGGGQSRRRFALRRCYADPARLGKNRLAFVAAGFELIDCPAPADGRKNAAGMNVALDVIEALAHPTAYEEFVLLSADTDLTPIIQRLHSLERAAVVYSGPGTASSNVELADGAIEEAKLVSLLFADEAAAPRAAASAPQRTPPRPAPAGPAAKPAANAAPPERSAAPAAMGERAEIEALARRIHSGTNIPLLSPRTFAELFRLLSEEVSERGYHFQETAERVSGKLTAAGRNVTRRQVVFVVKGLALKGHVFSTTDTAERLAEVFREQALYLVGNAGLELTDRERTLLPAWITGRAGGAPNEGDAPAPAAGGGQPAPAGETRTAKKKPGKPAEGKAEPPAAAPAPARPAPAAKPQVAAKAAETVRPAPTPPRQPPPVPPKAQPRPAAAPKPAPAQAKTPPKPAAPRPAAEPASSEALESSILAAIAQAVDVLIEDSHAPPAESPPREPPSKDKPPATPVAAEPKPDPAPSEGGESDDIGDEIQRIIASYSRARQQGET
jgi:hypothetical protein